jgi:hypothetical protein
MQAYVEETYMMNNTPYFGMDIEVLYWISAQPERT